MFIVSKRNYDVRRPDGSLYKIRKDFIGDIPEDVAASRLIQRAIRAGRVFIPPGTGDRQLEKADQEAAEKAAANDIRPDAKEAAAQDRADSDSKEKETEKRSPKNRS